MIDTYRRECFAIYAEKAIQVENVVQELDKITFNRGLPKRIKVDNGPEFISRALDVWAYSNNVKLVYLRPGTPTDNAYIESFNGSFGNECLNMNWFMSNENAKDKVEACKNDYNEFRPHSALTYLTPVEFARKQDVLPV